MKAGVMTGKEIIIGSHNTMSYLRPSHWWLRPLRVFARCQRRTLPEQLGAGARAVDLRVYRHRTGQWRFAHGAVSFRGHLGEAITLLPQGTIVRLILERSRGEDDEAEFRSLCRNTERHCPHLTFIGGYRKRPWEKLYTFSAEAGGEWPLHQWVGSMADDARWYERVIPCLYHRRKAHHDPEQGINLYDFL